MSFWTNIRIGGLTFFDVVCPLFLLISLLKYPKWSPTGIYKGKLGRVVGLSLGLLLLGMFMSSFVANDLADHFGKVVRLIFAFILILFALDRVKQIKKFTFTHLLKCFLFSSTVSSFVLVLQGKLGILLSLLPQASRSDWTGTREWTRLTGLSEHPIEAGYVAAYGASIAIYLIFSYGKNLSKLICFLCFVINVWSLIYSASFTAAGGLAISITILLFHFLRTRPLHAFLLLMVALVVVLSPIGSSLFGTLFSGTFVVERVMGLYTQGASYGTAASRSTQLSEVISVLISDPVSALSGHGYSEQDLPLGLEIHDAPIAAMFHFGLLGLVSQLILFGAFLYMAIKIDGSKRALYVGLIIIFFLTWISGPAFFRRSLWLPIVFVPGLINQAQVLTRPRRRRRSRYVAVPIVASRM